MAAIRLLQLLPEVRSTAGKALKLFSEV